jgi:hypothetical protein
MDFRKLLHANPAITVVVILTTAVGAYLVLHRWQTGPKPHYTEPGCYYSADEGQTFHAKAPYLVAPFDEDGKTWVRARVFTCDNGKTKFLGYIEKYTPQARQYIESQGALSMKIQGMETVGDRGLLVKKAGAGEWMPKSAGASIVTVYCPGTQEPAKEINPENWREEK